MKRNILLGTICLTLITTSCSDMLDMAPLDKVTPESYFTQSNQLGDYAIKYYNFPALGGRYTDFVGIDNGTDVQISAGVNTRWVPGEWRTPATGSAWTFDRIRAFNYFLEQVLPKYEIGGISGTKADIEHYIGEIYFLRAYEYFDKMKTFGDFPIITKVLPDDTEELITANERKPMNQVARFILSDLDKAISLMTKAPDDGNNRNRLTKNAAYLFKSRVALYIGTWLKYFKGTAFVPGTQDWPGNSKVYNQGVTIYETNIDDEISFFLTEAMKAAEVIADAIPLTENTFDDPTKLQTSPYIRMFADYDLSTYPEVIFWKDYDLEKGVFHRVNNMVQWAVSGGNMGYSRGYIESFLMDNGLPIYASNSQYKGDLDFESIRTHRDDRLRQFLKVTGDELSSGYYCEPPVLFGDQLSTTGYDTKKFKSNKSAAAQNGEDTGCPIFRAVEAYLNYMEADYELNGSISSKSAKYWTAIRARAGVNSDYLITVQATDMEKEAKNSFAAYSAGQLIDPILYNIRRERACELMSEGFRYADLCRWRAMDQLIDQPYHPEGINLWESPLFKSWYEGDLYYIGDGSGKTPNISAPSLSNYIRPYEKVENNLLFNGMRWTPAHYLSPIDMGQFNITSTVNPNGDIDHSSSPLYQNPGWPTIANQGPEMVPGF